MSYQFFASPREGKAAHNKNRLKNHNKRSGGYQSSGSGKSVDKSDLLIAIEVRNAITRNADNPGVLQAIANKVKEYELNRTIARDLGDKETETDLTRTLSKYLNSI